MNLKFSSRADALLDFASNVVYADMPEIADVQTSYDERNVVIGQVGVREIRYPVKVLSPSGVQDTVGVYDLDVLLEADKKGTHMSRFLELLEEELETPLSLASLRKMLGGLLVKLNAKAGRIRINFPYFIKKTAPVSLVKSFLDYEAEFTGEIKSNADNNANEITLWLKIKAPVTSLCPCSKKIAKYGAHNQRSYITLLVELTEDSDLNIETLIEIAESEASCQIWSLLKRSDEKYVTEYAYENPKFVEDLVRNVSLRLDLVPSVKHYIVEAENFESIHNHSAYALINSRQNKLLA